MSFFKKLFLKIFLGATGVTIALAAPIVPEDMKWVVSYETIAFDTTNGDLAEGEFAETEGGWYIREIPQNKGQFTFSIDQSKIEGKKEVAVRCEKCAYYSVFVDSQGEKVRVAYTKGEYDGLRYIKNSPQPRKSRLLSVLGASKAHAAIALDGTSNGSASDTTTVSSLSWSHVVTSATNGLISVATAAKDSIDAERLVSGVTYNADALTKVREDDELTQNITSGLWYRVTPDVGTLTVAITYAGTVSGVMGGAVSLTGVDQTTPVDASNTATASGGDQTPAVTTVAANSWTMDSSVGLEQLNLAYTNGGAQTTLYIYEISLSGAANSGYFGPQVSPGTVTYTWTCTGIGCAANDWISSIVSYAPVAEAGGAATGNPPQSVIFFDE